MMIKRIKDFSEKYKNANDEDKEYYRDIIKIIILIVLVVVLLVTLCLVCR